MKSTLDPDFVDLFNRLPADVRRQARVSYRHFKSDPFYPALHFKKVHAQLPLWSVRIGSHYRAVGVLEDDEIVWQWIGSHAEYDRFLSQF